MHWIRILEGISPSGVYEYRSSYLMASEISLTENCILSSSLTGTGFNPARLSSIWASFGSHNFSLKTGVHISEGDVDNLKTYSVKVEHDTVYLEA